MAAFTGLGVNLIEIRRTVVELDTAPAVLGVQWHPELLRHRGDHLALFEDLVQQALARRA